MKIKRWVFWKIHEKPIVRLVGSLIQSLLEKIEGLDSVSFEFRKKSYVFHKHSQKESV